MRLLVRADAGIHLLSRYGSSGRVDDSRSLFRFSSCRTAVTNVQRDPENLQHGPWVYRYTGAEGQEGAFVSCTFWLAIALAKVGRRTEATRLMDETFAALPQGSGS
jgi:GH15 family glucan-1,4-alpha-glucosidase